MDAADKAFLDILHIVKEKRKEKLREIKDITDNFRRRVILRDHMFLVIADELAKHGYRPGTPERDALRRRVLSRFGTAGSKKSVFIQKQTNLF